MRSVGRSRAVAVDIGHGFVTAAAMVKGGLRTTRFSARVVVGRKPRVGGSSMGKGYRIGGDVFAVGGGPVEAASTQDIAKGISDDEVVSLFCQHALEELKIGTADRVVRLGRWSELGVGKWFGEFEAGSKEVGTVGVLDSGAALVFEAAREGEKREGRIVVVDCGREAIRSYGGSWSGVEATVSAGTTVMGLYEVERKVVEETGRVAGGEAVGMIESVAERRVFAKGAWRETALIVELMMQDYWAMIGDNIRSLFEPGVDVVLAGGGAGLIGDRLMNEGLKPVMLADAVTAAARGGAYLVREA